MKILLGAVITLTALAPSVRGSDAAPPPDPKVRMAQLAKEDVEKAEKEVARTEADILKEIDAAIAAMKVNRPEAEKAAMAGMKELAARGRKLGKAVLDSHAAYGTAAKGLKTTYATAPTTFRDAAATFRRYADEEPFEDIKKDYLACAATWVTLAAAMEKRVRAVEAEEKEIAETMKFVDRSVIFLGRFEAFAAAYPEMVDADQRTKFLDQLRRYVEAYEGLRGSLGKFHDELKKQSLAPDLRAKPGDATAGRGTASAPAFPGRPDLVRQMAPPPDRGSVALLPSTAVAATPPVRLAPETPPRSPAIPAGAVKVGEMDVVQDGVVYHVRVFYAPGSPGPGEALARR